MPPKTTNPPLMIGDFGVELVGPAPVELPDVFAVGSEIPESIANALHPIEISLKLSKFFRCRSRKRLIKLLMSMRIERNKAALLAKKAHDNGWTYQNAWGECLFVGPVDIVAEHTPREVK